MRRYTTAAAAAALLLSLTGCGSEPDVAACKAAMGKQLRDTMAAGANAPEGSRPAACDGVDTKTLERLAGEVTAEVIDSTQLQPTATP